MSDGTVEIARKLRRNLTPAEKRLWPRLRDRRFAGFKFRRQHPVGPYIVDFYCASCRLVLELDRESHLENESHDAKRQAYIESEGLDVLRFWNTQVFDELEAVLERIYQVCVERTDPSPPTPLSGVPGRGE